MGQLLLLLLMILADFSNVTADSDDFDRFEQWGRFHDLGRFEQWGRFHDLGRFEQILRFWPI